MFTRSLVLTALTVALVPALANASAERTSAKACANAFATSLATSGSTAPTYRLAFHDSMSAPILSYYATDFSYTLEARDPKTGATIARAQCSTDTRGAVTSLAALPLDSATTK